MTTPLLTTPLLTTPLLSIDDVAVDYGGVHALNGVTVDIAAGEIVGFIGPNGSGKTTLLDVVSGFTRPFRGRVLLDGEDLAHHLPEDRAAAGITRSFQDCRLYPELSVEETLLVSEDARSPSGVVSAALRLPRSRRLEQQKRDAIEGLLAGLGLEQFRHNLIGELSTGTRRIVDLATILAARPRVLLLDEPTAGIAQREAEAFGPLLRRVHALTGAAICLIEHDVPLALSLCDRIVVMETGQVVTVGTPKEVMSDPAALAAYLGASQEAMARSGLLQAAPVRRTRLRRRTSPRPRPLVARRKGR
jgi:ABC-type branched-subunit amino acid transport system ATPase component